VLDEALSVFDADPSVFEAGWPAYPRGIEEDENSPEAVQ
jgi:hypothetical protein